MTEQTPTESPSKGEKTSKPFLPETIYGKIGLGLLIASFLLNYALVNVVQVPFLRWIMLLSVLVFSCLARFRSKDKSIAVIITLVLGILGTTFWILFLLGEIFIGHS